MGLKVVCYFLNKLKLVLDLIAENVFLLNYFEQDVYQINGILAKSC